MSSLDFKLHLALDLVGAQEQEFKDTHQRLKAARKVVWHIVGELLGLESSPKQHLDGMSSSQHEGDVRA